MNNSNFKKSSMDSKPQALDNSYLTDIEESSESFRKLQEKSRKKRPHQNMSNNQDEDKEEEENEEDEDDEEEDSSDEEILDDEQKSNISGFLKNLIKKVGAKSLFATCASVGGVGAIASLFVGIYRVHYSGEFEFKGISSEYQNFSFKKMNFTSFNKNGDIELSGLTKENKLTKTYYTMYSDNSYYAIVEDSEKYSNMDDAYKRENLLTPDELKERYPDIKDTEGREKMFQLNPDVLYSLDRYLHKNQFIYPQQFIKPVYYEESQDEFSLKQLTDNNGNLTAESQLFDSDGKPSLDSKNNLKKDIGVWDYGLASILRYKEYKVKERDVTSISGSTLKYKGYKNQNNSSDSSSVDKVVSESSIGKVDASYIPPGLNLEGTSSERDAGRFAYAIDTAVTAGGTISSKVSQKWQEKEGTRKTGTKTYEFTETETKEVAVEGEQKKEIQTIVHSYVIEYTYEYYTEEYVPYYDGDLDTSEITGSKYYRDYIKNYSNYIPVDVPSELDFSVFDKSDEVSSLLSDDTPGQYSSEGVNTDSENETQLSGKTFKAEFTAYTSDPKENGGYDTDSMGNKLDYTKNICAGPVKSKYPNSELTLGSKIVINGTNTDKDGMKCTVSDTGGGIVLDSDGTYHIDILVKDEATASKFGRRKGTITIVESGTTPFSNPTTSSGNSGSSNSSSSGSSSSSTNGASVSLPPTREGEDRTLNEILEIGKNKDSQGVLKSMKYWTSFQTYGKMYGIDPYLLVAMATTESGGDPYSSNGHALGIMQIEDVVDKVKAYNYQTKKIEEVEVNRKRLTDPDYCIKIGAMEFAERLSQYSHNILVSLQGYNYGGGGVASCIQYYLSGGTLSQKHSVNWDDVYAYAEMNHLGWITALYPGDMSVEGGNYAINRNPNDGKHDSRTWYTNTGYKNYSGDGHGSAWYIESIMQYYAGDARPWVMKPDGTIVTVDGSASGYTAGNSSAIGAFNSYLASNWNTVLELKEELFPWSTDLDKELEKEAKGDYSSLKNTKLLARNKNIFISNLTNTDVDITINMMFALNQGNYLAKYDYMGEAEWKAMYNQLLSSPTGKTWDDKWIGFTCEEVFGESLEDLGTLFDEASGLNPSISRPYGTLMNSISNDTKILSQYNDINFGIDLSVPKDTNVLALEDGEILSINKKPSPLSRYGVYVKIKYNEDTSMTIANLKELDKSIKVGSKVKEGQVIGVSGGNCKSYKENDLHIELLYNGNYINPEWIITRDMNGFDDPIQGNVGAGGTICEGETSTQGVGVEYVDIAIKQVGKPYVYGSTGPNSFDCSGLVYYSMNQAGITGMPRNSREQRKATQKISKDELQVGDLIFRHGTWDSPGDTNNPEAVTHVMIYIGNNKYVHAPRPGKNVEIKDFKEEAGFSYGRYSKANNETTLNNITTSSSNCQTMEETMLNGGMKIPLMLQTDSRWANHPYGAGNSRGNNIKNNGCSPSSLSMVISYMTQTTVTPPDVADWAGMKYYVSGQGTAWSIYNDAPKKWGFKSKQISNKDSQKIIEELKAGHPIIASMGPGAFTSGGHYIVLRGVTSDGKILVNDPASKERSEKSWNITLIMGQSKAMWAFSK